MPAGGPPVPIIPDAWSISSTLTWTNLGSGLGRFEDTSTSTPWFIFAEGNGLGAVVWGFSSTLPTGCIESLVTNTVGGVLQTGTVQRGQGTIADSGGHVYQVVQKYDGTHMTAILQ